MHNLKRMCSTKSCVKGSREAVRSSLVLVVRAEMALVFFSCSSEYDLEIVAVRWLLAGMQGVKCASGGETGRAGYGKRFHTNGKQIHGVHSNQTLVAIAIGTGSAETNHA